MGEVKVRWAVKLADAKEECWSDGNSVVKKSKRKLHETRRLAYEDAGGWKHREPSVWRVTIKPKVKPTGEKSLGELCARTYLDHPSASPFENWASKDDWERAAQAVAVEVCKREGVDRMRKALEVLRSNCGDYTRRIVTAVFDNTPCPELDGGGT